MKSLSLTILGAALVLAGCGNDDSPSLEEAQAEGQTWEHVTGSYVLECNFPAADEVTPIDTDDPTCWYVENQYDSAKIGRAMEPPDLSLGEQMLLPEECEDDAFGFDAFSIVDGHYIPEDMQGAYDLYEGMGLCGMEADPSLISGDDCPEGEFCVYNAAGTVEWSSYNPFVVWAHAEQGAIKSLAGGQIAVDGGWGHEWNTTPYFDEWQSFGSDVIPTQEQLEEWATIAWREGRSWFTELAANDAAPYQCFKIAWPEYVGEIDPAAWSTGQRVPEAESWTEDDQVTLGRLIVDARVAHCMAAQFVD